MVTTPTDSGTANLFGLDLPVAETSAAIRRVNRLAKAAKSADDRRTMDQIRADVLLDLLNGRDTRHVGHTAGVVDIQVDLTTLAGLDDNPGEIPGWGPVIADIARQVVEEQDHAQWRITVTDPESGEVVHNSTPPTHSRSTPSRRGKTPHMHLSWMSSAFTRIGYRPSRGLDRGRAHRRGELGPAL